MIIITFTQSPIAYDEKVNQIAVTIPLTSNVNPKEWGKRISYMYTKSYKCKQSKLGIEEYNYSFTDKDKDIVIKALNTLPKEKIIKFKF